MGLGPGRSQCGPGAVVFSHTSGQSMGLTESSQCLAFGERQPRKPGPPPFSPLPALPHPARQGAPPLAANNIRHSSEIAPRTVAPPPFPFPFLSVCLCVSLSLFTPRPLPYSPLSLTSRTFPPDVPTGSTPSWFGPLWLGIRATLALPLLFHQEVNC